MYSNFITPPDTMTEPERHTILIVDSDWPEIEAVALFCKTSKKFYNVHVYRADMDNEVWLVEQAERSEFVILNTVDSSVSRIKDKLVEQANAFYYGPKNFLMSNKKISAPIEFFSKFDEAEPAVNVSET